MGVFENTKHCMESNVDRVSQGVDDIYRQLSRSVAHEALIVGESSVFCRMKDEVELNPVRQEGVATIRMRIST